DGQGDRPDVGDGLPAISDHDEGCHEFRYGRANIAGTKNTERRTLFLLRIPFGDVSDADCERPASDADAERRQQECRVIIGKGQQPGRDRRRQHDGGVNHASAILLGPHPEQQANEAAHENGRTDEQPELSLVQIEVALYLYTDDREYGPYGETGGEGRRREPKSAVLVSR